MRGSTLDVRIMTFKIGPHTERDKVGKVVRPRYLNVSVLLQVNIAMYTY